MQRRIEPDRDAAANAATGMAGSASLSAPAPAPVTAGCLSGVRVLDLSRALADPFCTQLLGDLGAEVIKIEAPGRGDDTRAWRPPWFQGKSAYFLSCNRNKKGVTATPASVRLAPPLLGQHTDEVLRDMLGLSADKITGVRARQMIRRHGTSESPGMSVIFAPLLHSKLQEAGRQRVELVENSLQ